MTKIRWASVILILILGVVLRLSVMDQALRFDEALTYMDFVRGGMIHLLSHYELPNNHVGHSLLVYFSTYYFPFEEWAIRFPTLVFGIINIWMAFLLGRKIHSYLAGLMAALLVATSPDFILYSTNARGYQMVAFFVLSISYLLISDQGYLSGRKRLIAYIFCQAYGMFTVPTMLYPSLGFAIFLFLKAWKESNKIASLIRYTWVHGCVSIAVIFLYLPIILNDGFSQISNNKYTDNVPWYMFFDKLETHAIEWFHFLGHDFSYIVLGVMCVLSGVTLWLADSARLKSLRLLFISLLLAALIITFGKQVVPFFRTWQYAYLFLFIYSSVGFAMLMERIEGIRKRRLAFSGSVGLFAVTVFQSLGVAPVPERNDTAPFLAAPGIINYLKTHFAGEAGIFTGSWANTSLAFYAKKQNYHLNHDITRKDLLVIVPDDHEETFHGILLKYGVGLKEGSKPLLINDVPHASLYLIHPEDLKEPSMPLFPALRQVRLGRVASPWYGSFGVYSFPWIEHEAHGWQECLNEDPQRLLLYDLGLDRKLEIIPQDYPRIKILSNYNDTFIHAEWDINTKTPHRRFKNMETGEWLEEESFRK